MVEGNSGERAVYFTIALSTPSATPVVADWAVGHQTTNDGDVKRKTGTVTIAAGDLVGTIQVVEYPDINVEPDETYKVTLSNPVNATIAVATATGTVINDDPSAGPTVNVGDAAISEGNCGVRRLKFTVAVSDPALTAVTVDYATAAGTATTGTDFVSSHGTVTIGAGETTGAVTIVVRADAAVETDESFTVTLSNPSLGLTLGRATGTGSIRNDD
jgi:chitinase